MKTARKGFVGLVATAETMTSKSAVSFGLALLCVSAQAYSPDSAARETRFADPPASSRLMPIWHGWSNDAAARAQGLERLEREGFGGFVGNVNFDAGYLDSSENRESFKALVAAARAKGLRLWLYDEPGYPSGTAGGRVTDGHPERAASGYLFSSADVEPGKSACLAIPPGRPVAAAAWPLADGRLAGPRRAVGVTAGATNLVWTAPAEGAAKWKLVAWSVGELYEGTHAAVNFSNRIPYVNLLSKEPTDAFIACTHERYAGLFGGDLSDFDSFFTDEPSLMSLWMRPRPWSALPAAPELSSAWKARTGRDLDADAPLLAFGARDENMRALRYAFWDSVGRLVSGNYMHRIDEWALRHGTRGGGHLLLEEWTGVQLPLYGDFFRCLRALGNPGIDMLTSVPSEVSPQTAKLGGSAGALEGAKRVMCEVSDHVQRKERNPMRQVTEDEIAGTLNILLWGGVNTFTSYYIWDPFTVEQLVRINLRLARANTLLSEGADAADVALLYPADTMKTDYDAKPEPWCEVSGQAFHAIASMQTAAKALFAGNRAWMFTDASSLAEATPGGVAVTVTNGFGGVVCTFGSPSATGQETALKFKDLAWRAIVLPGVDTLPAEAMRRLHAFWKAGGLVVAFGGIPVNSESEFPSSEVSGLSREMFGTLQVPTAGVRNVNAAGGVALAYPGERTKDVAQIISACLEPPVAVAEGCDATVLRTSHRRGVTGDVFFVINDSPQPWAGRLRLCGGGAAERWDPQNGQHETFAVDEKGWGNVKFPAYGAMLFTTRSSVSPRRIRLAD